MFVPGLEKDSFCFTKRADVRKIAVFPVTPRVGYRFLEC